MLLLQGYSLRSIQRATGVHRETAMKIRNRAMGVPRESVRPKRQRMAAHRVLWMPP